MQLTVPMVIKIGPPNLYKFVWMSVNDTIRLDFEDIIIDLFGEKSNRVISMTKMIFIM
jgi:hypothetical protein